MSHLLIEQTASQRTWPGVGDIDDCWVLAWQMCQIAVAPWEPWLSNTEARRYAGDPDDGNADGNATGVDDMVRGIRAATPELGELITPLRGSWDFHRLLVEMQKGRPFAAAVIGAALQKVYTKVPHQVVFFWDPGVGLYCADPMAPDRSRPSRIDTDNAKRALYAFGGAGKVYGILFPTRAQAIARYFPSGGITQAQLDAAVAAAKASVTSTFEGRIAAMKGHAASIIEG